MPRPKIQGQRHKVAALVLLAIGQRLGLPDRIGLDSLYANENVRRRAQAPGAREFDERALTAYQAGGLAAAAETMCARIAARR